MEDNRAHDLAEVQPDGMVNNLQRGLEAGQQDELQNIRRHVPAAVQRDVLEAGRPGGVEEDQLDDPAAGRLDGGVVPTTAECWGSTAVDLGARGCRNTAGYVELLAGLEESMGLAEPANCFARAWLEGLGTPHSTAAKEPDC
jgi:hypothetical protein